jgi:tRNA wybutosine-synthesizing protein 1
VPCVLHHPQVEIEDLGGAGPRRGRPQQASGSQQEQPGANQPPEMLNALVRNSLTKQVDARSRPRLSGCMERLMRTMSMVLCVSQGYKIIGSHSGVKMCRWTKSQLRGRGGYRERCMHVLQCAGEPHGQQHIRAIRVHESHTWAQTKGQPTPLPSGGCYKHAFYGIESHRCMEATPSLACANKCVFCWRHHSNPVGRSWKWKMDSPDVIVDTALELHRRMIREYSG